MKKILLLAIVIAFPVLSYAGASLLPTNVPAAPTSIATTTTTTTDPNALTRNAVNLPSSTNKNIASNANAIVGALHPTGTQTTTQIQLILPEGIEDVQEKIIDQSIASGGHCPCPYSLNYDGYECGLESAYYRPGGFRRECYPQNIRGQEYIYYRKNHQ